MPRPVADPPQQHTTTPPPDMYARLHVSGVVLSRMKGCEHSTEPSASTSHAPPFTSSEYVGAWHMRAARAGRAHRKGFGCKMTGSLHVSLQGCGHPHRCGAPPWLLRLPAGAHAVR